MKANSKLSSIQQNWKQRLVEYYLWFPFSGIILIPLLALRYFSYYKEVITLYRLLSISSFFIFSALLALPFYLITQRKPPFLKGIYLYITLGLLLLSGIIIWSNRNNEEIPTYSMIDVDKIIGHNDEIFLIYTSDDCKYCQIMKPRYHRSANLNQDKKILKIDLGSIERRDDDYSKTIENKVQVDLIPTIIHIKNGKEIDRLVGEQNQKSVDNFFEKEEE